MKYVGCQMIITALKEHKREERNRVSMTAVLPGQGFAHKGTFGFGSEEGTSGSQVGGRVFTLEGKANRKALSIQFAWGL